MYLASQGYNVTGLDVSPTAISKCKELASQKDLKINWLVTDAVELPTKFHNSVKWAYSIGTLHMLVDSHHRDNFLQSLYSLLKPGGKALLVNLGDGEMERCTDPTEAFTQTKRTHQFTGKEITVASTSCRIVNWKTHKAELKKAGFNIDLTLETVNEEYYKSMTVYISKPLGGEK